MFFFIILSNPLSFRCIHPHGESHVVGESAFSATIPRSESLSHTDTETHLQLLREEGDNVAAPAAAPAFRAKRVLL